MPKTLKPAEYERLGRDFEEVVVKNYFEVFNLRRQIGLSFIKGVFAGFGGVIGATVMVALVLLLLNPLFDLPVVGQYIKNLGETLQQTK